MKMTVLQENLHKALSLSSRFVNTHAQLPVLSNILLSAKGSRLYLKSTNLEVSIATSIGAKIEEEGDLTLPARVLTDLVANLSKGAVVLKSEQEQLNIESENFNGSILGLNASEFPSIPQTVGEKAISLDSKTFIKALSQVVFSASTDATRPILTGVLVTHTDEELFLVGTDGFRLSQKKIVLKDKLNFGKVIVPKTTLLELSRIIDQEDQFSLEVREEEKQILFSCGDTVLSSRVIEGDFPPFEKIIPSQSTTQIRLNKDEFLRLVKLASVIARDTGFVGKLIVKEASLAITTESSRSGSQKAEMDAKVEGTSLEILYNLHFIEEFLNSTTGEEITIGLTTPDNPGVFGDSTDANLLHLIMPVKV